MIGIKCNRIILINIIFYSTNNNKIDLEEQLIDFYHLYFIKTECSADLARFLLSFIQTYITDNDNFNIDFVDVWNKEIKIFIKEKFPMNKNGQFIENSDIIFLIQLIDDTFKVKKLKKISKDKLCIIKSFQEDIEIKKRTNSMTSLRPHSQTIDSKDTRDSSLKRDNFGLTKQSSQNNIFKIKDINNNKNESIKEKNNINNKDDKEKKIEKLDIRIKNELTYQELVKKIIFENYADDNILLLYHFIKQCFSFIKIDDLFDEILNQIENLDEKNFNNLSEFSKVLIIEMIYYYQNEILNDECFSKAKNLCYILITKSIINMINNDIKINEIKRDKFIIDNLNIDINDINIFILKKEKEDNNIEEVNNENLRKSNLNKIKDRSIPKKVTFKEKSNFIEEINKEKIEEMCKISKTLRRSTKNYSVGGDREVLKNIIKEEDEKNEKSEDDKQKRKSSFDTDSDDNNDDLYSDDNSSKEENDKEEEKNKEIINNIKEQGKIKQNLISTKERDLVILGKIVSLLEKFKEKEIDLEEENEKENMKKIKNNIDIYKEIQKKLAQERKIFLLPRQRQKRMTKNYTSYIGSISKKPEIIREYLNQGYFCVTDWKTEEIGQQLMTVSKSLLRKIQPRELYRAKFLKKDKEKTSPNVVECINKFNRLTSFIMEDILSYNTAKDRAKIYEKWVLIADYCKTNKDYNDLIAIFSAFNHYIITGLKLTLKEVKTKTNSILNKIKHFCTVEGNYKNIRVDMDNCDKTGEIFIPYLGMLLRDINFFEEKSKYLNEKGYINFNKIEKINEMFKLYFKFKNKEDNKNNNIPELDFFNDLEDITEEYLEITADNLKSGFKSETSKKKRLTNIDEKYFKKNIIKENDDVIGSINEDDINAEPPDEINQGFYY
jgi:hypothetical protein